MRAVTVLLVVLLTGVVLACGESQEDKAQSTVCDARDDIDRQVNQLKELTVTTATTDQIASGLSAIEDDLRTIADAQGDLSDERRAQVEQANQTFTDNVTSIASQVGRSLSVSGATAQATAALQQLADSYRQTLAPIDCS